MSQSLRVSTIKLRDKIRLGKPIPFTTAALLSSFTPAVRLGMWCRLQCPRIRVEAHVISFGNITAGGTGKTPAVIERARQEIKAGKKVAILTRGYGSRGKEQLVVADGSKSSEHLYLSIGDEPALIARKVPQAIVIKCADRVLSAKKAIDECGCDTLIMDDGFQHVRLERDENIVLIDAANPFGNGYLLPRGILREPLHALKRATHFILTRCSADIDTSQLESLLRELCPQAPIRKTCHTPTSLWNVSNNTQVPLDEIRGKDVKAMCAIGNPESFIKTLEELGTKVVEKLAFPDHYHISQNDIPTSGTVITTEKDAVRIAKPANNVLALGIELRNLEQ